MNGEGQPFPLGSTWEENGWNFALYSRHATGVTLLLYAESDIANPLAALTLDPLRNKTGRIWHTFVPHLPDARYYAYRVEGPTGPLHRFDPQKVLLDPFTEQVFFPPDFSRAAAMQPGVNDGRAPLGALQLRKKPAAGHAGPRHAWHEIVIYELHVKGFTARANSGVTEGRRGTFLGLIEKIPHLKELGVTVVELLPVHQFDPQEGNYWGYMTLNFFAPHQDYAVSDAVMEFRDMVRAFHAAGIEVWLDVVYNHTCEGDESGPTYSWRGIDNSSYYLVGADGRYWNDTGCGNMLRCAHDGTRALILESLRQWVHLGVDGFRFDLASVLARDIHGRTQTDEAALISEITALVAVLDIRVVAEAWDIGVNLLGRSYPGRLWGQWNGQYRDDVRAFVRGEPGKVGALMQRLYGSDDLFPDGPGDVCRPYQSVNFITAHDGFSLYDLVAYNQKHNAANGHANTDGTSNNLSWNCGWEGDDGVPADVLKLRKCQAKNFVTLLLLANGTPMFCAGDEFLNTQRGNNNPYNQDNETTWLDWSRLEKHRDIFRFFQRMIAFRKSRRSIARGRYWREDVRWYGANGPVDFGPESRCLAYCLIGERLGEGDLYVMINAFWQPVLFRVQEGDVREWRRFIDTSRPSPDDIVEPGKEELLGSLNYKLAPRSIAVLVRQPGNAL
jgi:glycogen operon protein